MSSPVQPPLRVETVDGTTSGRPITTIKVTNGDLTVSGSTATIDTSGGGGGGGTVTSVGTSQAFITITDPTTTPSISIGNASGAATGVLTATDFNTFDAKQGAITLTTTGSTGVATFAADTLNIPNYTTPQASYLTLGTDAGLTDERVLTAGTGISFTDTGAGGTLTIETTGGGGSVTSVALTESGNALTITGSPITGSGTLNIAGAGDSSQVILGDLTLGTLTSGTVTSVTGTAPIVSSGGTTPAISLADTAVTPGSYTTADITVDAQGRITAASTGSGGGGSPGGSTNDIQVNNGGSFEGAGGFEYNTDSLSSSYKHVSIDPTETFSGQSDWSLAVFPTSNTGLGGALFSSGTFQVFGDAWFLGGFGATKNAIKLFQTNNSSNYMAFAPPSTITTSTTLTLPDGDGSTNQYLKTDGSGNLGWATPSTGGGIGGSITDNQVAVGSSTTDEIEGSSSLTFDASTGRLVVAERISSSGTGTLTLETNNGISSGKIEILNGGVPNHINITPASGLINIDAETIRLSATGNSTITTANAVDLILNTNDGTNSGAITINDGVDGNIALTPNGAGAVVFRSPRVSSFDTPASASAAGVTGSLAYDENYIYVCTATDTWKRVALSTW